MKKDASGDVRCWEHRKHGWAAGFRNRCAPVCLLVVLVGFEPGPDCLVRLGVAASPAFVALLFGQNPGGEDDLQGALKRRGLALVIRVRATTKTVAPAFAPVFALVIVGDAALADQDASGFEQSCQAVSGMLPGSIAIE